MVAKISVSLSCISCISCTSSRWSKYLYGEIWSDKFLDNFLSPKTKGWYYPQREFLQLICCLPSPNLASSSLLWRLLASSGRRLDGWRRLARERLERPRGGRGGPPQPAVQAGYRPRPHETQLPLLSGGKAGTDGQWSSYPCVSTLSSFSF